MLLHRVSNTVHKRTCLAARSKLTAWAACNGILISFRSFKRMAFPGYVAFVWQIPDWATASFASSSLLYPFTTSRPSLANGAADCRVEWSISGLAGRSSCCGDTKTMHRRHRVLLQCYSMIPSGYGKWRSCMSVGNGGKNTEKHFLHSNRVSCGLPNDHWRLLLHVRRIIKFGFAALTANAACQGGSHDAQHTGHPPKCNSISKDEAKNIATIQHDLVKNEFTGVSPWPMSLLQQEPAEKYQKMFENTQQKYQSKLLPGCSTH